jgi:subtilase family serine protease
VNRRLRQFVVLCVVAAAACSAVGASAAPLQPTVNTIPFTRVSAKDVQQAPVCPNGLVCYTSALLKQAYDFPNDRKAPTGAGQTIVVVTAFGSAPVGADISSDLAQFDAENNLPDPAFSIWPQQNHVSGPPPAVSTSCNRPPATPDEAELQQVLCAWAVETSLDVEYAHATAPGAKIVLAVADTDDSANVIEVEKEALAANPGAIVTQSFGGDESGDFGPDSATVQAFQSLYLHQILTGGTIVASSGDFGATSASVALGDPSPPPMAEFPATSPLVLAVGGTMGYPDPFGLLQKGRYGAEQVWNEVLPTAVGASGGGPSTLFPAPPWQFGVTGTPMRAEPDVSYNAANNGGVVVILGGMHGVVGGTSAAAPQWAGIVALANELRGRQGKPGLGLATPQLYAIARDRHAYRDDFHDITIGSNALFGSDWAEFGLPGPLFGYSAKPGYDFPTGLGTPDVGSLLKDLSGRENFSMRFQDLLAFLGGGSNGHHGKGHGRFRPGG